MDERPPIDGPGGYAHPPVDRADDEWADVEAPTQNMVSVFPPPSDMDYRHTALQASLTLAQHNGGAAVGAVVQSAKEFEAYLRTGS